MAELADKPWLQSQRHKDQHRRADELGAHPDLLDFKKRLIARMAKQHNVPLWAHCVWRDEDEQNRLYEDGFSRAKWGQSAHNYGLAVDLVHGRKAWNLSEKAWAIIGHVGKEIAGQSGIAVTWGGDWKFYDPAHWELKEWKLAKATRKPGQRWP